MSLSPANECAFYGCRWFMPQKELLRSRLLIGSTPEGNQAALSADGPFSPAPVGPFLPVDGEGRSLAAYFYADGRLEP
jgi:hypothetical protein